jgi:hypothetical protein
LILTVILAVLILGYSMPGVSVYSGIGTGAAQLVSVVSPVLPRTDVPSIDPAVESIERFLKRHEVDESQLNRVAQSVVASARKYNLDPKLIASIMIVESRANPFAISGSDAIGMMQIHLPTWGHTADLEGINLFKIEDNVDFGTRILKDYVRESGLWQGVKRYNGWNADDPESEHSAEEYLAKVQRIYTFQQPTASTTDILQ